jgi:hypothetical protein
MMPTRWSRSASLCHLRNLFSVRVRVNGRRRRPVRDQGDSERRDA